ncbi:MAG: transcription-repair coupling factor, partial [Synergistaceae bacterium]|nr:transcription-repair coupling factor [Synergistaceae bacterium]
MKTPVETRKNRVWDVEEALWKQGVSIHLPVDGAARCWVCRAPQGSVVAVFPDAKQAGTFLADWKALFPEEPVGYLQEIPLTPQGISNKALAVQRGETLSRWREEGGVLVATGGGLLGPVARGGGEILLEVEKEYERNALLDWLVHSGYVRSDLVWAPGQFVLRGYILDVYDPAYAYPLRLEFYDDTLESIRSFSPRTQKSVAMLDALHIHSLSITREASVLDFFTEARPGASTESAGEPFFLLFEPVKIESSAETYELLWKEVAS